MIKLEERKFSCFKSGEEEMLTISQLRNQFASDDLKDQKAQGTTFHTWLRELIHMQILNEIF